MANRVPTRDRKLILLDNEQSPVWAEDVAKRLQNGETLSVVSAHLQVSDSHLREWLRRNGYHSRRQPSLWTGPEAGEASGDGAV